jgi:hypothetical protein
MMTVRLMTVRWRITLVLATAGGAGSVMKRGTMTLVRVALRMITLEAGPGTPEGMTRTRPGGCWWAPKPDSHAPALAMVSVTVAPAATITGLGSRKNRSITHVPV